MQPLKFKPILKETIWGGKKIGTFKHIDACGNNIGESWEISGVKHSESIVANGPYEGKSLSAVIATERHNLMGMDNYKLFGNEFPLLIKFIDASQDLSIQVHPDDYTAKKYGLPHGKTEMWYLLNSDAEATIRCGLKEEITPEIYKQKVENETICDVIAEYKVKADDCFYIPGGRIHSIGKGCFLTEIQQTSDTTFRIYDFKRKDKNGNYRQLHTKEAAECIDYTVGDDYQISYVPTANQGVTLVRCEHFCSTVYDLNEPMTLDYSELDSFVILIGVSGKALITDNEGNETTLCEGETILIPATTQQIYISGTIKFIETYV